MSEKVDALIKELRKHCDELIYANSKRQAIEWMATADRLLYEAAKQLEKMK